MQQLSLLSEGTRDIAPNAVEGPDMTSKPPCDSVVTHLCLLGDFTLAPIFLRPLPALGENGPRNRDSISGEERFVQVGEDGAMQRWHGRGRGHMLNVGLVMIQ